MPTHCTRAVEVDAFQWTGRKWEEDERPMWLKEAIRDRRIAIITISKIELRIHIRNGEDDFAEALQDDYLIRFPDGRIEKRTPEEFEAEFEAIPADEYLTQEELDTLPEIKALTHPGEKVPRFVLYAAEREPLTEEDIEWMRRVADGRLVGHIPRVLDALRRAWEREPSLRLGQLIDNVMTGPSLGRLWMLADSVLEHGLHEYRKRVKNNQYRRAFGGKTQDDDGEVT